jgi:hypothetical protein
MFFESMSADPTRSTDPLRETELLDLIRGKGATASLASGQPGGV